MALGMLVMPTTSVTVNAGRTAEIGGSIVGEGATIGVDVSSHFATPSEHTTDRCAGNTEFPTLDAGPQWPATMRDEATGVWWTTEVDMSTAFTSTSVFGLTEEIESIMVTHQKYRSYCVNPDNGQRGPGTTVEYWVPVVTQERVTTVLWEYVEDYLSPPAVSWPSMDREFGWLYVKAPMDFRVSNLQPITLTASVTNPTGSVEASITATPTTIVLGPGEPGAVPVTCSLNAATAGYSPDSPGACSYAYQNSSAIAPDAVFWAAAVARWTITTSSPSFPVDTVSTWSASPVAVAEVQAVVTG